MRNRKHVKAKSITSKKYLSDQRSKERTTGKLEDVLKQFEDTNLTFTETSHETQTANGRSSTQCNSETNSVYTLSPDTTNNQESDIAVENIILKEQIHPKMGYRKADTWQINNVKQMFICSMGE